MESVDGFIFIIIVLVSLIYSARSASKIKAKLKARANKEYDSEAELTNDELKSRLGEAEVMYEELEQTYWVHIGVLVGIVSYFYWHVWYLSISISVMLIFVGDKYLSIKPFKSGVPDR